MIDMFLLAAGYVLGGGCSLLAAAFSFVEAGETRNIMIISSIPVIGLGLLGILILNAGTI